MINKNKSISLTAEGYAELLAEVKHLKSVKRIEVSRQLEEASSYGDLRENAEYDAAKEIQQKMEARIAYLESILARANVLNLETVNISTVSIGNTVKVLDVALNKELEFSIVSTEEAKVEKGYISPDSPVGNALIGRKVGDIVSIRVPKGMRKFRLLSIGIIK